jgi:hypothetical protein
VVPSGYVSWDEVRSVNRMLDGTAAYPKEENKLTVAPEPYLSACMTVVYRALLHARLMGFSGTVDAAHIADLMDAVHNIPDLVQKWDRCDIELIRTYLKTYEEKWAARGGLALCEIFDQKVVRK